MKEAITTHRPPGLTLPQPISRGLTFWRRHGFRATVQRAVVSMHRLFSSSRMVVFYCDLLHPAVSSLPSGLRAERKTSQAEIDPKDWDKMMNFSNAVECFCDFSERFRRGASIWLIWSEGNLAGYGWTMIGNTLAPYYHPFGPNDVHFFDFLIFPEFRGRNINPVLADHILLQMSAEHRTRAYIEVREWNKAQLRSLQKTKFQLAGIARKGCFFGRTLVAWTPQKSVNFSALRID